jgi:DNA repair exonuclease SbcCD nuclease subunit
MSYQPVRFLHASDLHLERPVEGLPDVSDSLREAMLKAPQVAAQRIVDTALAEEVDFVVLCADVLNASLAGPSQARWLANELQRLDRRGMQVYWLCGEGDAWPYGVTLPENVHRIDSSHQLSRTHFRDEVPVASLHFGHVQRAKDLKHFTPDREGLFSIGVATGSVTARSVATTGIDYWALGGRHQFETLTTDGPRAIFCGTPQGRNAAETGPHGCTLVDVDSQRHLHTRNIRTDTVRWHGETLALPAGLSRSQLDDLLDEQVLVLMEEHQEIDLLVSWTLSADSGTVARWCRTSITDAIVARLREQWGTQRPGLWSVGLEVAPEADAKLWLEEETLLGDLLREIERLDQESTETLDLEAYIPRDQIPSQLAKALEIHSPTQRRQVLREVAAMGIALLGPQES